MVANAIEKVHPLFAIPPIAGECLLEEMVVLLVNPY
jgi:hypothetical protein